MASKLNNLQEGSLSNPLFFSYHFLKELILLIPKFIKNTYNEYEPVILKKLGKIADKPEKPFYIFLIISLFFAILYKSQPNNVIMNDNRELYALISTLFLVFNVGIYKFFRNSLFTIYAVLSLSLIIWLIHKYKVASTLWNGILNSIGGWNSILLITPIILLAVGFNIFQAKLTNIKGIPGFIVNFIFYIPCLIRDFVAYMKNQFSLTPSITYLLLGLEVIVILLYLMLQKLLGATIKSDADVVLQEAKFLNMKPLQVAAVNEFYKDKSQKLNKVNTKFTTFSLSSWIYINQNNSTAHSNILRFGPSNSDISHPQIKYNGHHNGKTKLEIIFNGNDDDNFNMVIENQKWNNFVFNFIGDRADLFVNGDLVKTVTFKYDNAPDFKDTDVFEIGDVGLDGAICNVKYYKTPLTKFQITNIYNVLNKQNPPINNIM
jgi:hypothetical protein